jgi:uncharacterized protein (DUF1697 family)
MNRYVAPLRGINVGRAKRIAMAHLRALFERQDCKPCALAGEAEHAG